MSQDDVERLARILGEIRDHQKLQLERQTEALALQREQFALVQKQAERAQQIQDRAESLQDRSAQMVASARRAMAFVLPLILALVGLVVWLVVRWLPH